MKLKKRSVIMWKKEAEAWVSENLHNTEEDFMKAFINGAELAYNKVNKRFVEELKSQVIQDCKGRNYCTGCGIWNPWEEKCTLFDNRYNNSDKICPRFVKWEMLVRIKGKIDEMFGKEDMMEKLEKK